MHPEPRHTDDRHGRAFAAGLRLPWPGRPGARLANRAGPATAGGRPPAREASASGAGLRLVLALCVVSGNVSAADIATVDIGGVGQASSLAIGADGLPAMTYRNGSDGSLLFAKCENLDCSSAIRESIEDASGEIARGDYSSLRITAGGKPVVAWYDSVDDNLAIARCANADCSDADVLRTLVDTPDDTGREAAMIFGAGGRPLVAYVNTSLHSLEFATCEVPSCSSVSVSAVDDDPVNSLGTGADVALGADGMPVIVYLDTTADAVLVAKCAVEDCSAGTLLNVLDPQVPTTLGSDPVIAIGTDGNPVISYFDEDDLALKVAHCSDPACAGAVTTRLIDDQPDGDAGRHNAIAIRPDGTPVVSYQRWGADGVGGADGAALRVAECSSADCSGAVRIVVIDSRPGEITGADTDIVIGSDGGAVVSYYDTTGQSLKVAKCGVQSCAGPGDRLFGDGFE